MVTEIYDTQPIKDAMKTQGLSVQDLAEKSRISRPTIYEILDAKPTVKIETIAIVASSLGVSLNALFPEKTDLAA